MTRRAEQSQVEIRGATMVTLTYNMSSKEILLLQAFMTMGLPVTTRKLTTTNLYTYIKAIL